MRVLPRRAILSALALQLCACYDGLPFGGPEHSGERFITINADSVVVLEGDVARLASTTNVFPNEYQLIYWNLHDIHLPDGTPQHLTFAAPQFTSALDHRNADIHTFMPGRARVIASFSHLAAADTAILVVLRDELASAALSPSDTTLRIGDTLDFFLELRSVSGRTLYRHDLEWTLSDSSVAALTVIPRNGFTDGLIRLTAMAAGEVEVRIVAGPERLSASASIVVEGGS